MPRQPKRRARTAFRTFQISAILCSALALPVVTAAQTDVSSARTAPSSLNTNTESSGSAGITEAAELSRSADTTAAPAGTGLDALGTTALTDSLGVDSTGRSAPRRDSVVVPDTSWRWPQDARASACEGPLESLASCWRSPQASPEVALRETGFPGIRADALNLRGFEPARVEAFFQPALVQSPYGTGGPIPFAHYEADAARGLALERWVPVQPLDTPVTDLHWMRGALLMNQFGITLHRMVGNRAYVGFDYLSSGAEGMFYDYAFQVHQPFLGAGRDSLSLVIQDTSHSISSRHVRPRVGWWIDRETVAEVWADWFSNSTSMVNPTNPADNDSVQSRYPAAFSAATFGGVLARGTDGYGAQLTARHASWERNLAPRGGRTENAEGSLSTLEAAWTMRRLPGAPQLTVAAELTSQSGALWTNGAPDTVLPGVSARDHARADRETAAFAVTPAWTSGAWGATLDVRGTAARRARADGVVETLGDLDADGRLSLPAGFHLTGGAGFARTGAPDDLLFRWQPALGLYPNPDLTPRTHARIGGGGGWESRHAGLAAAWESHRFGNTWLPRVLPHPNACLLLLDTLNYRGPGDADMDCVGAGLSDEFALAHVNYARETRELLHLSAYLAAGNWRLSLRSTSLLDNRVEDPRLGFKAENFALPLQVVKGQLLWKRVVLDGRLGLQTRWDWEWFSSRYAFASDGDGTSRVLLLDEYLALDFTTQMDIRTFSLYFRAMNLYHDRYATEAGVHPPGVNFRFGVNWRLRN